jgi:hypothetical protein
VRGRAREQKDRAPERFREFWNGANGGGNFGVVGLTEIEQLSKNTWRAGSGRPFFDVRVMISER